MPSRILNLARRVIVGAWIALDFTRRALLNLLVLLLLIVLAWALLRPGPPAIAPRTTLVLDLQGPVREQFSGGPRDNMLRQARGQPFRQTRLRDVLTALEAAAQDPAIVRVLLLTDDFAGAGPATLRELAAAIGRVRAAGKPVWAWASAYSQPAYFVAAHADRVFLHPMGGVWIEGFGGHRTYFREAFERVGIDAHVLRAGAFKSAGETWVASGPSPETLQAEATVLDALWTAYSGGVEAARRLPAGALPALVDALPQKLAAVQGDAARLALAEKLVDELATRDQMQARLMQAGASDDEGKRLRSLDFGAYLTRVQHGRREAVIGVVVAEGGIRDGDAPPGAVGGDSTSALVKRAREDERVKAVVLRVDSPGGSAFASEQVRRELELTRAAGKPVVVSMGDIAASGGYWISMAADEVIADPVTITGSIGVITMFPGFHEALAKLGLRTGGYATTWLAGAADPRRPLDPRLAQVIQSGVDHTYARFTGMVAAARGKPQPEVDAVAQGRIWTGEQALERGLVDRNGSFGDAIHAAASRAKLADGQWQLRYVEVEPGRLDRLFGMFASEFAGLLPDAADGGDLAALARALLPGGLDGELAALLRLAGDAAPGVPLAHCLCGDP
jgi:protease IV